MVTPHKHFTLLAHPHFCHQYQTSRTFIKCMILFSVIIPHTKNSSMVLIFKKKIFKSQIRHKHGIYFVSCHGDIFFNVYWSSHKDGQCHGLSILCFCCVMTIKLSKCPINMKIFGLQKITNIFSVINIILL